MTAFAMPAAQRVARPSHHERGFSFHVRRSLRKQVAEEMGQIGLKHGFEVDHVGFLGGIRCTYRERNADAVGAFIATGMRDHQVKLIPDYQARYGVIED